MPKPPQVTTRKDIERLLQNAKAKKKPVILTNKVMMGLDLSGINFTNLIYGKPGFNAQCLNANFQNAILRGCDFTGTDLAGANLQGANLTDAKLAKANLYTALLQGTNLTNVNLRHTNLSHANLTDAVLNNASLNNADLGHAIFRGSDLDNANFSEARLRGTTFDSCKLNNVHGLDCVHHKGPSHVSIDTLYLSSGQIPEVFLRGCGLSDWQIENTKLFNPNLNNEEFINIQYRVRELRFTQVVQINPLFISYSHRDKAFVDHLETCFKKKGIRYWRDVHHATAGRLETQIDLAIAINDIVLLVLSEHSTESDWVEYEVGKAREKEKTTGKDAMCPVALDNSWKDCRWSGPLRKQIEKYHILDFSNWQDPSHFQRMFTKLLEGLNLFYK